MERVLFFPTKVGVITMINRNKSVKTNGWHVLQNVRLTVLQTVRGVGGNRFHRKLENEHSQKCTKYSRRIKRNSRKNKSYCLKYGVKY